MQHCDPGRDIATLKKEGGTRVGATRGAARVRRAPHCARGETIRVQASGFRVQGSGFRVQGSGSRGVLGCVERPIVRGVKTQPSSGRVFMMNTLVQ